MTEESGMWKVRVKIGDCEVEVVGPNKGDVEALFKELADIFKIKA